MSIRGRKKFNTFSTRQLSYEIVSLTGSSAYSISTDEKHAFFEKYDEFNCHPANHKLFHINLSSIQWYSRERPEKHMNLMSSEFGWKPLSRSYPSHPCLRKNSKSFVSSKEIKLGYLTFPKCYLDIFWRHQTPSSKRKTIEFVIPYRKLSRRASFWKTNFRCFLTLTVRRVTWLHSARSLIE